MQVVFFRHRDPETQEVTVYETPVGAFECWMWHRLRISEVSGLPPDSFRLVFAGKGRCWRCHGARGRAFELPLSRSVPRLACNDPLLCLPGLRRVGAERQDFDRHSGLQYRTLRRVCRLVSLLSHCDVAIVSTVPFVAGTGPLLSV